MELQKLALKPKLELLKETFVERCSGMKTLLCERGCRAVSADLIAELRLSFLVPLKSPTPSQLKEELPLISALSVVIDLVAQGWTIAKALPDVVLEFRAADSIEEEKERLKRGQEVERDFQLREASVRAFIRGMEKRRLTAKGWHSIFSVMRDGQELAGKLGSIAVLGDIDSQVEEAARVIRPYLQFVEADDLCEQTGLRLGDIWRYFRHTWSNTYKSIPGRSMMILVRDAAAPCHPVIGIAALGSSVVQQKTRDKWIGWDGAVIVKRLEETPAKKTSHWLNIQLEALIQGVYKKDLLREGLLTRAELRRPSEEILAALLKDSDRAIKRHRLYPHAAKHKRATDNAGSVNWAEQAETSLFRSKRAKLLYTLLSIKRIFLDFNIGDCSGEDLKAAFQASRFRGAVAQLCRLVKAERVGINMMDVTVCGAVAPYNVLLGGKLICMLLCSAEVIREYARRYDGQESVIASSMRGASVTRSAKLVLLCTTSLYGSSLSQYTRVKIPARIVGGKDNEAIEYRELGASEGFGSFHFSGETLRLLELLLSRSNAARKVNSIFGEGVNPLMRKIRDGLSILGLPADELLKHGNRRIVYGVALARNFSDVLVGFSDKPQYTIPLTKERLRTGLLADYWRQRWLLKRILKPGIIDEVARHACIYPIQHGAQVQLPVDRDENLSLWAEVR